MTNHYRLRGAFGLVSSTFTWAKIANDLVTTNTLPTVVLSSPNFQVFTTLAAQLSITGKTVAVCTCHLPITSLVSEIRRQTTS